MNVNMILYLLQKWKMIQQNLSVNGVVNLSETNLNNGISLKEVEIQKTLVEGKPSYFVTIGFRTKGRTKKQANKIKDKILKTTKHSERSRGKES